MLSNTERTMETYKKAGAMMRLLKEVGGEALVEVSKVLKGSDSDRFWRAINTIDIICCRAEDNMFRDHPELSNEYTDVFYGSLDEEPRSDVGKDVIALAREAADELFR